MFRQAITKIASNSRRHIFSQSSPRTLFTSAKPMLSADVSFKHQDEQNNNPDTPFDFSPVMYEKVKQVLAKYPAANKKSGIIPLLDLAQQENGGWLSLSAMNKVADICGVPPIKVYEVATFYSMFNRSPIGKYQIQVCVTTPCMITGCDDIIRAIEKHLHIKLGETTEDKMFTLGEMECMGCCVNAPMIVVSDFSNPPNYSYNFYEDLTCEKAIEIIEMLRRGEKPVVGSQTGRQWSAGIQGKTTLQFNGKPPGPYCRNLDETPAAPKPAQK